LKPSTSIKPLSLKDISNVPGVLGQIAQERITDYQASELSKINLSITRPSFAQVLKQDGLSIIAEIKRSSPSQGAIADLDPIAAAQDYAAGGASALSILTEERQFGGKLEYISQVAEVVNLPILRKDFTVHPQQIIEAKNVGASAVLLIVAILGAKTAEYLAFAQDLGLDVLVEVHDEAELELALKAGTKILGVNNRNLKNLKIDLANAPKLIDLAKQAGFEGILVAESGYKSASELSEVKQFADAVLIGTSIAGSGNLKEAVRNLKACL